MYPLNMIVPPIAYRRSMVLEKGMNIPTSPVIPAGAQRFVSRMGGRACKRRTESDEAAEEPGPQTGKVILNAVRRACGRFGVQHTLDWKVKAVKPTKTPKVINLRNDVRVLPLTEELSRTKLVGQPYC